MGVEALPASAKFDPLGACSYMVLRTFKIDSRLWLQAGILAAVRGESRSAMIRDALQAQIDAAPPEVRVILRAVPE